MWFISFNKSKRNNNPSCYVSNIGMIAKWECIRPTICPCRSLGIKTPYWPIFALCHRHDKEYWAVLSTIALVWCLETSCDHMKSLFENFQNKVGGGDKKKNQMKWNEMRKRIFFMKKEAMGENNKTVLISPLKSNITE